MDLPLPPPLWVGTPTRIAHGPEARQLLKRTNDKQYHDPQNGTLKVPLRRWKQAQHFEREGWIVCWRTNTSDRNDEHLKLFDNYKEVPPHLGNVLEVGCGPFTQLQTIIEGRTADSVTLLDPLIMSYKEHVPACPYKDGTFKSLPTTICPVMAEELNEIDRFDTLICINVIEHVMDALKMLENMRKALKPGGTIIFGERVQDDFNPNELYDIGHPIRIKTPVVDFFKGQFKVKFTNGSYFIGTK